ncbi:protein phosphatase 2C domain-containing protein [Roseibacillus persicicus]|uniref:protein phosphatase 2C domain-containing protein n=1 Tax=Roseibacillus persicicus TaxID=454148 RepID=UPI00280ED713|nr:protein phosphatase 2C domain-containing protein [Roseibacillus persicicus]MDQ8189808.1 protein phosphatase 2C domain-containing protein [Roseibacillus persicicus]
MFQALSSGTLAGNQHNEDLFSVSGRFAWIMDGVTGITDRQLFPSSPTDAVWFVRTIDRFLKEAAITQPNINALIRIAITETISRAKNESEDFLRTPPHLLPAASFSIICHSEDSLHLASIGDCPILVKAPNGSVQLFGDNRVTAFEAETISLLSEFQHQAPEAPRETHLEALREPLLQQRRHRNSSKGFWVADPTTNWLPQLVSVTIPEPEGCEILLCTDGLYRLCDLFHKYQPDSFFDKARTHGIPRLLEEVRHLESMDPNCTTTPRIKTSDDATGLLLTLS